MYILIISRGYPTEKYKMNGIFEYDQAKALAEAGHKVIYAGIDMRSVRRVRKWGFESIHKDNLQIETINLPCGNIPKNLLNSISEWALKILYKRIERKYGKPDIVHSHFIGPGYITAKLFKESNIPIVLTEHFSGMNGKELNPYLYEMGAYTYQRMNKVIAVSEHLACSIKEKFKVEATVIPNVVDTKTFSYKEVKRKEVFFSFVSTGNLLPNKSMDVLIEAFYIAFKDNEKVRLYIYGDGPEKEKLAKMISNRGLSKQILLMGLVNRREIAEKMMISDCFVLASKLETFGVAYIEAMSMGLPVIATKCGGPEDFITEENGLLVPVDNIEELAIALLKMHNDSCHYNKAEISNLMQEKFSYDAVSKKLTAIYEELLIIEFEGL